MIFLEADWLSSASLVPNNDEFEKKQTYLPSTWLQSQWAARLPLLNSVFEVRGRVSGIETPSNTPTETLHCLNCEGQICKTQLPIGLQPIQFCTGCCRIRAGARVSPTYLLLTDVEERPNRILVLSTDLIMLLRDTPSSSESPLSISHRLEGLLHHQVQISGRWVGQMTGVPQFVSTGLQERREEEGY